MNCPACGGGLQEKTKAGITLDECEACTGIWFDRDELSQYHQRLATPPRTGSTSFDERTDLSRRACPRCRVLTLRSGTADGERALSCANCRGIFLSRSAVVSLGQLRAPIAEGASVFAVVDGETVAEVLIEIACAVFDW